MLQSYYPKFTQERGSNVRLNCISSLPCLHSQALAKQVVFAASMTRAPCGILGSLWQLHRNQDGCPQVCSGQCAEQMSSSHSVSHLLLCHNPVHFAVMCIQVHLLQSTMSSLRSRTTSLVWNAQLSVGSVCLRLSERSLFWPTRMAHEVCILFSLPSSVYLTLLRFLLTMICNIVQVSPSFVKFTLQDDVQANALVYPTSFGMLCFHFHLSQSAFKFPL